jgi:MFS transporter, PPP family, 3-phenylpropionic acid transporter
VEIRIKKGYYKLRLFMIAYWAMMLGVLGMYTMYIVQAGFSKMEISITVTVLIFSALIGQNFLAYLADRFGHVKRILLFSVSMGIIIALALIYVKQHWHIYILLCLWGFFVSGTVPLTEAWCIGILKSNGDERNFGKIRGFGSIGYAIFGVVLGFILQNIGWHIYPWYILISVCVTLVTIFFIHEDSGIALYKGTGRNNGENGNISFKEALIEIIKIKPLKSVIIIVFMYTFVVRGIYSYLGVLVSDFGGGPLSLGFTYLFDAGPEIVTFFLTAWLLRKFHSKWLIFASFILQIVRLSLILVFNSSLAIMLLGILSGFAYGLLASSYKTYIYELAPEKYKISCLSLSESIIGLSGVISAPVFGFVIMKFGGYASIAMGLGIDVAAALYIAGTMYKERERQKRAGQMVEM